MPRGGARPGAGRKRKLVQPPDPSQIKPPPPPKPPGDRRGGARKGAGRGGIGLSVVAKATPAPDPVVDMLNRELTGPNATPLQYMLAVMRNPNEDPARRDKMAISAAPFLHARLTGVAFELARPPMEMAGSYEKPVLEDAENSNDLELARRIAYALAMGAKKAKAA